MLCEDIIRNRKVEYLSPHDTAQAAARRMRDENIGFLPICDGDRRVLGTLTDRDLTIRLIADNRPATSTVADLMTRDVVSCRPKDDLHRAEQLMGEHHKSRIICCDQEGRLVGVVSLSDIAHQEEPTRAAQTMREVSLREVALRS